YHRVKIQIEIQRSRINVMTGVRCMQQCWKGRRKAEEAGIGRVIEGLDAEPVTGDEETVVIAVPDGKRKHAIEALQTVRPPGMKGLEHHFGIAIGKELVSHQTEFIAQLRIVVNRAIEHQ